MQAGMVVGNMLASSTCGWECAGTRGLYWIMQIALVKRSAVTNKHCRGKEAGTRRFG